MTKATRVHLTNQTNETIQISPIYGSVGRWSQFVVNPGETKILRGHNDGYDVEFRAQGSSAFDPIIGDFRADNPFWNACFFRAISKGTSFGTAFTKPRDFIIGGKSYEITTQYFGEYAIVPESPFYSLTHIFGVLDQSETFVELKPEKFTEGRNSGWIKQPIYAGVSFADSRDDKDWFMIFDDKLSTFVNEGSLPRLEFVASSELGR